MKDWAFLAQWKTNCGPSDQPHKVSSLYENKKKNPNTLFNYP